MRINGHAQRVVELAAEQWGLVTSGQARAAASVTPQQLKRMTDSGLLERLHHGIYRLTHIPHDEHLSKRLAWLALDPEHVVWERLDQDVPTGVLSHRTAAEVHRLGDLDADDVELTAARRIRLSLPNVTVHRGHLTRDDWQIVDELPVTTPVRTICDLAAAATDAGHLASVVRDALIRNLTTIEEVASALAPYAFDYGHRPLGGEAFLDALIEQAGVPTTTLGMADLARKHSMTTPFDSGPSQQLMLDLARTFAALAPQIENLKAEMARAITPMIKTFATIQADPALMEALRTVAPQGNSPDLEALRAATAQEHGGDQ